MSGKSSKKLPRIVSPEGLWALLSLAALVAMGFGLAATGRHYENALGKMLGANESLRDEYLRLRAEVETGGAWTGESWIYQAENQKLGAPAKNENRIVFFGDSITEYWNLPDYFQNIRFKYINRGIRAQRTNHLLARFERDVVSLRPVAVVLLGGINDVKKDLPEDGIRDNLLAMIELARFHGIQPIVGALPEIPTQLPTDQALFAKKNEKIRWINRQLRDYCAKGRCRVADYEEAFAKEAPPDGSGLFVDRIHPNKFGYLVMARTVLKLLGSISR